MHEPTNCTFASVNHMLNPFIFYNMKLTKKTVNLICELENMIGNSCYNPNSYDGWTQESGCSFRYPITYTGKDGDEHKSYSKVGDMDKDRIRSMRYRFGSNHLYIGDALINILDYLEEHYGLDFNRLSKVK